MTWNWRGSSTMHTRLRNVTVTQMPPWKSCANILLDLGALRGALDEAADAAEHGEDDEEADRQKGRQLDERLGRDGHDQAFLVLGGIDVAGAEQDGEGGHQQRDDQCRIED